jgi:hypothetical protein
LSELALLDIQIFGNSAPAEAEADGDPANSGQFPASNSALFDPCRLSCFVILVFVLLRNLK